MLSRAVMLSLILWGAVAHAEIFADIGAGSAWTRPFTLEVDRGGAHQTLPRLRSESRSFESPPYYVLAAGLFLPNAPAVGFSAGFVHMKIFAEGTELFDRFSISHGYNHVPVEAILRWPRGVVHPYVAAGPSVLVLHPEVAFRGEPLQQRYTFGGFGVNAEGGVRATIRKPFGLFAHYRLTWSRADFDAAGARFGLTELTHHAAAGLSFSF